MNIPNRLILPHAVDSNLEMVAFWIGGVAELTKLAKSGNFSLLIMTKRTRKPDGPKKPDQPRNLRAPVVPVVPRGPKKIVNSSQNQILVLLAIVAALSGIAFAVHRVMSKPEQGLKALTERPKTIFDRVEPRTGIDRATLPSELESALKGLATLELLGSNYDPAKPNFYIIPQSHLVGGADIIPEIEKEILDLQANILRIQHVLFSFGARTQFLEGVSSDIELQHNVVDKRLAEDSARAMQQYLATGKIKRAYIALEGVYGEEVASLGAEDDFETANSLRDNYKKLERNLFPLAKKEIMEALAREFDLEIPRDPNTRRVDTELLKEKIWKRVSQLTPSQRHELVKKYVLTNSKHEEFLEAATKRYYNRIQGRNRGFLKVVKEKGKQEGDASFVVGAEHIEHLTSILGDEHNFFLVVPDGFDRSKMHASHSQFSEADYKQVIFEYDLYIFGLGPKPSREMALFD